MKILFFKKQKLDPNFAIKNELFNLIQQYESANNLQKDEEAFCRCVDRICEILLFENPYSSKIVFHTPEKVNIKSMNFENPIFSQNQNASGIFDLPTNTIYININKNNNIGSLFYVLGHEFTHFCQGLIFSQTHEESTQNKLSKKMKNAIRDFSYPHGSSGFFEVFDYIYQNVERNANSAAIYNVDRQNFSYCVYAQKQDEEDARINGMIFAFEMINAMLADKLCPSNLKIKLAENKKLMQQNYEYELASEDSYIYKLARTEYEKAINQILKIKNEQIIGVKEPFLKADLMKLKLFALRTRNAEAREYLDTYLSFSKFEVYSMIYLKNKGVDVQQIVEEFVKNDPYADPGLLFENNMFSPPTHSSTEKIVELCRYWIETENFYNFLSVLIFIYGDTSNSVELSARIKDFSEALQSDERLDAALNEKYQKYENLANSQEQKTLEDMDFLSNYELFFDCYTDIKAKKLKPEEKQAFFEKVDKLKHQVDMIISNAHPAESDSN